VKFRIAATPELPAFITMPLSIVTELVQNIVERLSHREDGDTPEGEVIVEVVNDGHAGGEGHRRRRGPPPAWRPRPLGLSIVQPGEHRARARSPYAWPTPGTTHRCCGRDPPLAPTKS
jgi:hypothetical protein